MATESVAIESSDIPERLNHNAALLDGVAAALQDFVESSDKQVARIAFVLSETVDRVNAEISTLAMQLGRTSELAPARETPARN